jgi:hypothetical protein
MEKYYKSFSSWETQTQNFAAVDLFISKPPTSLSLMSPSNAVVLSRYNDVILLVCTSDVPID